MKLLHPLLLLLIPTSALIGVSGFAAQPKGQPANNGQSLKQIQDQMKSLKAEMKKTKTMINNNKNNRKYSPPQVILSDNASGSNTNQKDILKAIQNTNSRVGKLEKTVSLLRNDISKLRKTQLFAAAIRNAEYNSFVYWDVQAPWYTTSRDSCQSVHLVREMFVCFSAGLYLHGWSWVSRTDTI